MTLVYKISALKKYLYIYLKVAMVTTKDRKSRSKCFSGVHHIFDNPEDGVKLFPEHTIFSWIQNLGENYILWTLS